MVHIKSGSLNSSLRPIWIKPELHLGKCLRAKLSRFTRINGHKFVLATINTLWQTSHAKSRNFLGFLKILCEGICQELKSMLTDNYLLIEYVPLCISPDPQILSKTWPYRQPYERYWPSFTMFFNPLACEINFPSTNVPLLNV